MTSLGMHFGHRHGSNSGGSSGGSSGLTRAQAADASQAVPPILGGGGNGGGGGGGTQSTCVEPDHRELIRAVGTILHRRVRDNEDADTKITMPLFCEDTHTESEPEERYEVTLPLLHLQMMGVPTMYTLARLPPPKPVPKAYPVPHASEIAVFLENIRQRARLTPQALVITLIYVDRMEARSKGVLLHARSWRPVVFASILLASKVWHDISYWNSDFSSICPMFTVRNINKMERAMLTLLQYNTMVSPSQYASYYFSLRVAARAPGTGAGDNDSDSPTGGDDDSRHGGGGEPGEGASAEDGSGSFSFTRGGGGGGDNFRSKYLMAIQVAGSSRLQEQTAAVADHPGGKGGGALADNHFPVLGGAAQFIDDGGGGGGRTSAFGHTAAVPHGEPNSGGTAHSAAITTINEGQSDTNSSIISGSSRSRRRSRDVDSLYATSL